MRAALCLSILAGARKMESAFHTLPKSLPFVLRSIIARSQRSLSELHLAKSLRAHKGDPAQHRHPVFSHKTRLYRRFPEPWYSLQLYKVHNLKKACAKLDCAVLKRGETFSFWHQVGHVSPLNGYKKSASVIDGELRTAFGGGLCQLSNALYWCALHCGCAITERHRHGLDIFPDSMRTVPFGCGASVMNNFLDFRFMQNVFDSLLFRVRLDDEFLYIDAYSSEAPQYKWFVEERNHRFERGRGDTGLYRKNEIYRLTAHNREPAGKDGIKGSRAISRISANAQGDNRQIPRSQIIIEEFIGENRGKVLYDVPDSCVSESSRDGLFDTDESQLSSPVLLRDQDLT